MKRFKSLLKNEDGQAMVMFAFLLAVLLGFAALVVDVGMMYTRKAELQTAADAGALAGAQELPESPLQAKARASIMVNQNGVLASEIFALNTPYNSNPHKIEVVLKTTESTTFARILGINEVAVEARAVAERAQIDLDALKYTLFSGKDIIFITSKKETNIKGDVYGFGGIEAPGAIIDGEAVVQGTLSTIDIQSATKEIPNKLEVLPDLWPVISRQTKIITTIEELKAETDFNEVSKIGTLNDEIIRFDSSKSKGKDELDLQDMKFTGTGIIFNTGPISIDGGGVVSKDDSIIFYSAFSSKSVNAIHFTGSGQVFMGMLFAPNGPVQLSGTDANYTGRIIAKEEVKFSGGSATVDGTTINTDVFDLLKNKIRLVE